MLPYIVFDKIAFGPITIQVWGLFVSLGILAAAFLASKRAKKRGIKAHDVWDCAFYAVLSGLVGGKLVYVLTNLEKINFLEPISWLAGGYSSLGAVIGGIASTFYFVRRKNISIHSFMDVVGPALLLAEAFGRTGCFLLHEHLGKPTVFFLGINVFGVTRHDLGLYFLISAILGILIILWLEKRISYVLPGTIGILSVVWYFFTRFSLEFLLESEGPIAVAKYGNLTIMQYASIFSLVLLFIYWQLLRSKS